MKKVEKMALKKVLATLEALDLKYKIVLPEGTYYTNMTVEEDRAKSKKKQVNFTPIYKDAITNIKVGEVITIDVPENISVERIRSIVAAQMYGRYGAGAHISTVDGRKIEVLRLA